jgi:hypothetical protein
MALRILCLLLSFLSLTINAKYIKVSDSTELKNALKSVKPGDNILLQAGTYQGNFEATTSGTESQRITLKGTSKTILTGGSASSKGYCFHLEADYWVLNGIQLKIYLSF